MTFPVKCDCSVCAGRSWDRDEWLKLEFVAIGIAGCVEHPSLLGGDKGFSEALDGDGEVLEYRKLPCGAERTVPLLETMK